MGTTQLLSFLPIAIILPITIAIMIGYPILIAFIVYKVTFAKDFRRIIELLEAKKIMEPKPKKEECK
jgi:hypothetical protein